MKSIKKIVGIFGILFSCYLGAQNNAMGGAQGIRQEVASLSDICQSELDVISSKVDVADALITIQLDTISSKIDSVNTGSSCVTPITTTTTISLAGSYYLANNIAGDVAITGTGITFDLAGRTISGGANGIVVSGDDVVIKNGTVRNAADSGIKIISGSRCVLEQIISTGNNKGFMFFNVANATVASCFAIGNWFAGFVLGASSGNVLIDCQALDNGSTSTAYGFFSYDGVQNSFKNCLIKNTISSAPNPIVAAGFRLSNGESATEICNCCVNNTSGNALLYGILFDTSTYSLVTQRSFYTYGDGGQALTVSWLATGGKFYLAATDMSSSGSGSITVNEFDPLLNTLHQVASFTITGSAIFYSVAWHQIGSDNYLAIGGLWGDFGDFSTLRQIGILKFDPTLSFASRLTQVATILSGPYAAWSLDWLTSGTHHYLAAGFYSGGVSLANPTDVQVLEFNPVTPTLTLEAEFLTSSSFGQVLSVDWQEIGIDKYLAVGCISGTGGWGADNKNIRILTFDAIGTPTLLEQASFVYSSTSTAVYQVAWHHYIDGNYYLAVAGAGGTGVLEYSVSTSSLSLGPVAFADHESGAVVWFPGTPATPSSPSVPTYFATSLANPGNVSGNIRVYSFTPSTVMLDSTFTYSSPEGFGDVSFVGGLAYSFPFIAVGGNPFNGPKTRQLQVFDFRAGTFAGGIDCLIKENVVHNILGENGIGYSIDACQNIFVDNTAYANGTDYQFTATLCLGNNIHNDVVALESKADVLESKIDACCTNMSSKIDWIVTYLMTHP